MKQRRIGFVLTLAALMVVLTGALALTQWGVLDFLFPGTARDELAGLTQKVDQVFNKGQVELKVDSAFYDGETFAMDWTIHNMKPQEAVYVQVEAFTLGGVPLTTDGSDSFAAQWLPGMFAREGGMQDGERIALPLDSLTGDTQAVLMDIGIYRPTKPIFRLPEDAGEMDEEEQDRQREERLLIAKEKMQEGYLVLWEDLFAITDQQTGEAVFVLGDIQHILSESDYQKETLSLRFDLSTKAARAAHRQLRPQAEYLFPQMKASYQKAARTPAGVYLELLALPLPGQEEAFDREVVQGGTFEITDGAGQALKVWPLDFYNISLSPGEGPGRRVRFDLPLTKEQLPEALSITFVPADGGQPLLCPVPLR